MTTTISNPKMSFQYYYLDNGRYTRTMHYAETLQEAIYEAKGLTCGERIEVYYRYGGLLRPAAIVEPDGKVIKGIELRNYK